MQTNIRKLWNNISRVIGYNFKNVFIMLEQEEKYFTLTTLTKHLNSIYKMKKSGLPFNTTDCEFYIKRGKLPKYLGGQKIEKINLTEGIKFYALVNNINNKN